MNVNQVDYSFNYTTLTITNSSISPVVISDDNNVLFYCNATEELNNQFYFNYKIFRNETNIYSGTTAYNNYNNQKYNVYNISYLNTSLNERYIVSFQASNIAYNLIHFLLYLKIRLIMMLLLIMKRLWYIGICINQTI